MQVMTVKTVTGRERERSKERNSFRHLHMALPFPAMAHFNSISLSSFLLCSCLHKRMLFECTVRQTCVSPTA